MQVRVMFAAALLVLAAGCAQVNAALGRGENEATQHAQEIDPGLAGLDVVEGGYVRVEEETWGCDYKCYNFPGRWFSGGDSEIPVYAAPRISAPLIGHLDDNEWVNAVRHEHHFRPRRAIVTRAGGGVGVGEVLYLIWAEYDDSGEGAMEFWHRGRSITLNGGEDEPGIGPLEGEGETIDWIYIEREGDRRNGWLRDPTMYGVEGRADECPAWMSSAPCRDIRSRGAPAPSYPRPAPFRDCADCPSMVWIPGQAFAMSQYEITIAQWNACIADHGCPSGGLPIPGPGDHPITNFSGAPIDYLEWLSHRTEHRYRLPTRDEWSAAAFPGGRPQVYYWGNEAPVCDRSARNGVAFGVCGSQGPFSVGSFQPNAFGLYDVLGNAAEMATPNTPDYEGDAITSLGGSWRSSELQLGELVSLYDQNLTGEERGFRVVRER